MCTYMRSGEVFRVVLWLVIFPYNSWLPAYLFHFLARIVGVPTLVGSGRQKDHSSQLDVNSIIPQFYGLATPTLHSSRHSKHPGLNHSRILLFGGKGKVAIFHASVNYYRHSPNNIDSRTLGNDQ